MKEPLRFETPCPICGKPVLHVIPPEAAKLKDMLMKLAKTAVHEHCATWEAKKANERAEHEKLVLRTQEWGGICPPLFQDTDEERLRKETRGKLDAVLKWRFGSTGLLLHGPTRTGKTRTAYAVLKREFAKDRAIGAMSHAEFTMKVMTMQGADNQWRLQKWCDVLRRLDILFIDDLGKGKLARADGGGSAAEEVLFHVFEERTKAQMPTFWTTEHKSDELRTRLSFERCDAFLARLREFSLSVAFTTN